MKSKSLLGRRTAAVITALGVAAAGAIVMSPAANAALVETNYGFRGSAYGTTAYADQVGLGSGPTAFATIGCTRLAGRQHDAMVAAANAPANTPMLSIGAVTSHTETFKRGTDLGMESWNKVANIAIGAAGGPRLVIKGLETKATAWADKNGKFHTSGSFKLADITAQTGTPVDDVLNQVNVGFGDLVKTILSQSGDNLVIPGVGRIELGRKVGSVTASRASSSAGALRIVLFGPNGAEGGGDDIRVDVGRSRANVFRNLPAAVMGGHAYAADVNVLGGLVGIGKLGFRILPCSGTGGHVRTNSVGALNPLNLDALDLGAASGRVYGLQNKDGSAVAWTEGRLANLNIGNGQLVIKGVVGRATMTKSKSGKITKSKAGTKVGSITAGGKEYDIPAPGEVLEIPGLATIRFGVVNHPTKRAIQVTAIRITLVPAAQQETGLVTINLGVAVTRLARL